jgi:ketosteroid isomerase-like protein
MTEIAQTVRAAYRCYETKDRAAHEKLIAEDFHFSSPYDDRVDRAEYFRRCWPNSNTITKFTFKELMVEGDRALVIYEAERSSGPPFRNAEFLRIHNGQIHEVEIYFGWNIGEPRKAPGS